MINNFKVEFGDFIFNFQKGKLAISKSPASSNASSQFSFYDWQRLLFGVISPEDIQSIINKDCTQVFKILFPVASAQVPLIDQL
jgi:hypothetical protein